MSFAGNEAANSQPVFCYTFARGASLWRYTDQPQDVTVDSVTYRAAVIRHDVIQRDEETAAGTLAVTCAEVTPVVAALTATGLQGPPITVTIRQTHRAGVGGVVTPATAVRYKGVVQGRERKTGECIFTLASIAGALDRPILRVLAAPTCQVAIYSARCGVDKTLWQTGGCAITAITGRDLSVAEAALNADGYYTAAPLLVENGSSAGELLFVESHVGTTLTLLHNPPPGLAVSDTLTLYRGCDGSEASCIAFGNQDWFLGFPRVPTVNPFQNASP